MQQPSNHWLWRLSASDWLLAGLRELEAGRSKVEMRRTAITHARRGAGMALNGVLVHLRDSGQLPPEACITRWGRSYIDHLRVLAHAAHHPEQRAPFDPTIQTPCQALMAVPVMPPRGLVQLSATPNQAALGALHNASTILEACRRVVSSGGS